MKRRTLLTAAVTAGTLAVSGLGLAPAATAEELAEIKDKGVIRIAMSGAYPPFNFVNEQNEVVGFDPAIGTEIAERMGLDVEIVTTAWDGIIGGLLANRFGHVPRRGETIRIGDYSFEVVRADSRRVHLLSVCRLPAAEGDGSSAQAH